MTGRLCRLCLIEQGIVIEGIVIEVCESCLRRKIGCDPPRDVEATAEFWDRFARSLFRYVDALPPRSEPDGPTQPPPR